MHNSRSHDAVIRIYDAAGNVIGLGRQAADLFCYGFLVKAISCPDQPAV